MNRRENSRKPAWIKAFRAVLACAREKTRKNYKKTGVKNPGLWVTRKAPLHTAPRLRQWEKGGYAAEQPYMPMLGPLSLSRLLLRWASLACSCCHSATLGEAMTAFTVRAT